ncbi:MerR family transcriptional regulator [Streptococcus pacificus]|uniref:MerR family transcriptional regulator n=1 Tax=Streptococcus pacificus TaxID=2740577 RepID=A0ABS0ZHQ9_9STRE|nr:MerR family transcriptional regulator [Streptococcus pacificus]MBJ8325537.1 MerR family transcriptional regulator [Streptococcus pacificus]
MTYLVKKVSEISGVSVRTLHHYDKIGLLSPQKNDIGYQYYTREDLATLQTILFYKYLGFSLKQIKDLLTKDDSQRLNKLKNQLELMNQEKFKLLTLIETLEKTILAEEGKLQMTAKEQFKGFTYQDHQEYEKQGKEKYGEKVVEVSKQRQKGNEKIMTDAFNYVFTQFSSQMKKGEEISSLENKKLAEELYHLINQYGFDCSLEIFGKIGLNYVQDDEFRNNIDQFGEGTAKYISEVIQAYVNENID